MIGTLRTLVSLFGSSENQPGPLKANGVRVCRQWITGSAWVETRHTSQVCHALARQAFDERGTIEYFRERFLDVFDIHKANARLTLSGTSSSMSARFAAGARIVLMLAR
jgi:hypothetical protein